MTLSSSKNIAGNYYPKYTTNNRIAKILMSHFLKSFDTLVEIVAPNSIHEVGCGEGYIISRYALKGLILKGTDTSKEIISQAIQRNDLLDLGILFETRSIEELGEEDKADLIICSEVLEHVENPQKALGILSNLASPYLLLSVPNEPLWRVLNMFRGKYLLNLGNTPGHINHWSKKGIVQLVERYFQILKIETPVPWTILLCKRK